MGVTHFIHRPIFLALSLITYGATWGASLISLYLAFVFGAIYARCSPPQNALKFRGSYVLYVERCIPPAYLLKRLQGAETETRYAFLRPGASFYFFIRDFVDQSLSHIQSFIFCKNATTIFLVKVELGYQRAGFYSIFSKMLPVLIKLRHSTSNADRWNIHRYVGERCKHSTVTTRGAPVLRVTLNGKFFRRWDQTVGRWVVFGFCTVWIEYYEKRWICELTKASCRRLFEIAPFEYGVRVCLH